MRELPHLKALVERHPNDLAIFGVDTDEDPATYRENVEKHGVIWPSLFDGPDLAAAHAWGVAGFPTIYVLDEKGVIRSTGAHGAELERLVDELVEAKSAK